MRAFLILALAAMLCACGGGDPERDTMPVDCKAEPRACA